MHIRISLNSSHFSYGLDSCREASNFQPPRLISLPPLDDADIRDTLDFDFSRQSHSSPHLRIRIAAPEADNFLSRLFSKLDGYFSKGAQPTGATNLDPADINDSQSVSKIPFVSLTSTDSTSSTKISRTPTTSSHNLEEAAANTNPQFKSIIRGNEAQKDAQITDQASFARAVDEVAKEYGLDPNMFRAQLEAESGAFSQGYLKAMKHEGDLGRASENNTSIGLGQISRKFLDGREWSDGGPNNSRVGGQTVTTEQYMNSPTIQLRIAAANLAMRMVDHGNGDLQKGLLYYVSGHTTRDAKNGVYLDNIEKFMRDEEMMNLGR